jgi:thioredoxin reductase (NADPH)
MSIGPSPLPDVAVVGGGPVGLHAARKAALLGHRTVVLDAAQRLSRAFFVAAYHNLPGCPDPISGRDLLKRQRAALERHRDLVEVLDGTRVVDVAFGGDRFVLQTERVQGRVVWDRVTLEARTLVLATGVVDRQPEIGGSIRTIFPWARAGVAIYCMLCDGHTLRGHDVAVIGHSLDAAGIAEHAARFARRTTLLLHGRPFLPEGTPTGRDEARTGLTAVGIDVVEPPITALDGLDRGVFGVTFSDGTHREFGRAVLALGFHHVRNELAVRLGGAVDLTGLVEVDEHLRILDPEGRPLPGAYAVGDVNTAWNQLPVGFGDAERAVIHAHLEWLW